MLIFWTLASVMTAAVLVLLVPPLLRGRAAKHDTLPGDASRDANVALYRERLAELERDRSEIEAERYAALREDLERGLLADVDAAPAAGTTAARPPPRWMAVMIGLMVPVCGLGIYLWLGSSQAIDPRAQQPRVAAGGTETAPDVEAMVDSLAAKLAADPANAEGWLLLARSRVVQERFGEAIAAFEKAHALLGDSPSLLADWAEVEAAHDGNRFPVQALGRLDRALELDPGHQKALWLGGFAAVQHGRADVARVRWERLLARQPPESQEASLISDLLARVDDTAEGAPPARRTGPGGASESAGPAVSAGLGSPAGSGEPAGPPAPAGAMGSADPPRLAGSTGAAGSVDSTGPAGSMTAPVRSAGSTAPAGEPRVVVEVILAPDLAVELGGGEPVFVFARTPAGRGPPAAVARTTVAALPTTLMLDESSAMMPSRSLASIERVLVTARVARSGTVTRTSGDVEGIVGPIPVRGAAPVRVVLSQIVP